MKIVEPLDFLTTKELADILRVKERKIYEMAAANEVPFTRVTGKLLFPKALVISWLSRRTELGEDGLALPDPPVVALGSHDPLLDWALRESGSGMASFFDGSLDGFDRFARREGVLCGMHVPAPEVEGWNRHLIEARMPAMPVVLMEWAWRERGLIVPAGNPRKIAGIADLAGCRTVPRQPEAGTQLLFDRLTAAAGLAPDAYERLRPARSEQDVALAVLEGQADAGLGLASVAAQYRLGFVPLVRERFDLAVWRRSWFSAPVQAFFSFCRTPDFADRAAQLGGYDVSGFGRVHYNGP